MGFTDDDKLAVNTIRVLAVGHSSFPLLYPSFPLALNKKNRAPPCPAAVATALLPRHLAQDKAGGLN